MTELTLAVLENMLNRAMRNRCDGAAANYAAAIEVLQRRIEGQRAGTRGIDQGLPDPETEHRFPSRRACVVGGGALTAPKLYIPAPPSERGRQGAV